MFPTCRLSVKRKQMSGCHTNLPLGINRCLERKHAFSLPIAQHCFQLRSIRMCSTHKDLSHCYQTFGLWVYRAGVANLFRPVGIFDFLSKRPLVTSLLLPCPILWGGGWRYCFAAIPFLTAWFISRDGQTCQFSFLFVSHFSSLQFGSSHFCSNI